MIFVTDAVIKNLITIAILVIAGFALGALLRRMKSAAENYWLTPGIAELTPWMPEPGRPLRPDRLCPRMTAVCDNGEAGIRWMRCLNLITVGAWVVFVRRAIGVSYDVETIVGAAFSFSLLSTITTASFFVTRALVRSERLMFVSGKDTVSGMYDDWPSLATAPSDADFINESESEIDRPAKPNGETRVFTIPGEGDFNSDQCEGDQWAAR